MSTLSHVESALAGVEPSGPTGGAISDVISFLEDGDPSTLNETVLEDQARLYNSLSYHPSRGKGQGGTDNFGIAVEIGFRDYQGRKLGEVDAEIADEFGVSSGRVGTKRRELKNLQFLDEEYNFTAPTVDFLVALTNLSGHYREEDDFTRDVARDLFAVSVEGGGDQNLRSFLWLYSDNSLSFNGIGERVSENGSNMPVHYKDGWLKRGLIEQDGSYTVSGKGKYFANSILHHHYRLQD